jgi:serine phosphatase RsbU (regulator of sigma subunit)
MDGNGWLIPPQCDGTDRLLRPHRRWKPTASKTHLHLSATFASQTDKLGRNRETSMELDDTLLAQQQVVRLQALLEASRQIHSTIALDEVLTTVLQIVVRELELTGAFFTTFPNTYGDVPAERMTMADLLTAFPLHDKAGETYTELVVIRPFDRILTFDELDFLESLAIQASVAIENARFHQRTIEWQRVESDLASARNVQRSLLPQEMPHIPGYNVAMRSVTCYEVGGDYLDIVPMANGQIMLVVADVAGKGLASALVGTSFRSAFRAMVNSGVPLLDIATRMNLLHHSEGTQSRLRYVTAFFMQLDPATNTMTVVNAGHNPAFLLAPNPENGEQEMKKIPASGTPVGLLPFSTYAAETHPIPVGTRLLVYTDGLTEVFHGEDEFGESRLLDSFVACDSANSDGVLESLWSTLNAFSDGSEQSDDMTALVLLRQADAPASTEAISEREQ